MSAFDRVVEVALGGATGLTFSFVLPLTAHRLFAEMASNVLNQMAETLEVLLGRTEHRLDRDEANRLQDPIRQAVDQLSVVSSEAGEERMAHLGGTQTAPLLLTIVRLRYDLVTIGRVITDSLSPDIDARLEAPIAQIRVALAAYLRACGEALVKRRASPVLEPVVTALHSYTEARGEGLTLKVSANAAERFFAFGFALEQVINDVQDLARRVDDWASTKNATASSRRDS